ncbi:MAG: hypothetical protein KGI75_29655 [Rhizobiaceae bacterium]|nr:hypothetical protein [Rhizobiaceae bacterium]
MLSAAWSSFDHETDHEGLDEVERLLEAELKRFDELVALMRQGDPLIQAIHRLPPVNLRHEQVWETKFLSEDFDDFDPSDLGQFPRKSAGNCGAWAVDGTPTIGPGQRAARDPS